MGLLCAHKHTITTPSVHMESTTMHTPPVTLEEDVAQLEAGTKAATKAADSLLQWEHTFLDAEGDNHKAIREWGNAPEHVKARVWALYTPKQ